MPTEQTAVVHLVTEQPGTMMVFAPAGPLAVEIVNKQPAGTAKHAVGLTRNTKQIFAVTHVQAESEGDNIEGLILKRKSLGRAPPHIDTALRCDFDCPRRRFDAAAFASAPRCQPLQPCAFAATNLEDMCSGSCRWLGKTQYFGQ